MTLQNAYIPDRLYAYLYAETRFLNQGMLSVEF